LSHVITDCIGRTLTDLEAVQVNSRHAGLGAEWNELGVVLSQFSSAQAVFLFCKYDDGAAFRRFIRQGRKLRSISQLLFRDSRGRDKTRCLAVSKSDGSGLIQKECVYVAGCFHCTA